MTALFGQFVKQKLLLGLISLLLVLVCFSSAQADTLAIPKLPPGFSLATVATNLAAPTHLAFAPDGRIFVSLKNGELRVIKNDVLLPVPFLKVDTNSQGEHGLIGVAFDPDFLQNSYLYIYYIAKTPNIHARVSRFTAQGDVADPTSEKILLDMDDRRTSIFHVSGGLGFGPDGKLYISSGDNAGSPSPNNSQLLSSTLGKILRINSDGSIPIDNPFFNQTTGIARSIWATGFRNPFSFNFSPSSQKLYVNDVGQSSWEEINDITKGGNYGWPLAEGMDSNPDLIDPVFTYGHGPQSDEFLGCAITGGDFYEPLVPSFPNFYLGKYFYMDYCNNWIRIFDPVTGFSYPFGTQVTSSGLGLKVSHTGEIYILSQWFGAIYKIVFTGTQAPLFVDQPQNLTLALGQSANFRVSTSGADPISYQWRRNGVPISGANSSTLTIPSVTLEDGNSNFDCIASNSFGTAISQIAVLRVINALPPSVSIEYPLLGKLYNAGDTIYYGGTITDERGNLLPISSYTWNVYFHHDLHMHPFISNVVGRTAGFFQIPAEGEASSNTWYEISLTGKDANGIMTTQSTLIFPNKSTFVLKTNPPGLQVTLDAIPVTTPTRQTGVAGFLRELGVISPVTLGGTSYEFDSWSDGAPANHTIRTRGSTLTYTANFRPVGNDHRGTITASPNPAIVCDNSGAGTTTFTWNTSQVAAVEIRINAPNGNLLVASNSNTGSVTTQKWIGEGSTFYLQDRTGGLPLTAENTLATITVNLTSRGCNTLKRHLKN